MTEGIGKHSVLKFVLTAFFGARIEDVLDENGNMEKCVCIPIDRNNLYVCDNGKVSAYAFVNKTRNANMHGWTHYLRMKCQPDFVKKITSLGYEVPYLGNLKPANYIIHKGNYENTVEGKKVKVEDYE
jgi:hypothetical protein